MLRPSIIALIFLALCALMLWDSSSFSTCMQHHQDNTANDALHYKGSMFGGAFWRYLDCLYAVIHEKRDDLLAIFTIVLAFSTILLWVATRDLANDADLLPDLPSFIRRVCSSFAPGWGVLRTQLV
jgi:hypothetical protein